MGVSDVVCQLLIRAAVSWCNSSDLVFSPRLASEIYQFFTPATKQSRWIRMISSWCGQTRTLEVKKPSVGTHTRETWLYSIAFAFCKTRIIIWASAHAPQRNFSPTTQTLRLHDGWRSGVKTCGWWPCHSLLLRSRFCLTCRCAPATRVDLFQTKTHRREVLLTSNSLSRLVELHTTK